MRIKAKLKIADLEDIFYGDMRSNSSPQWLKPHIAYCILENDTINGVFFTPEAYQDLDKFTYYLQLVFNKKLLIINNIYSNTKFVKEIELSVATLDNFHSFSHYFLIYDQEISGPFQLGEEFLALSPNWYKNKPIIQAFNNGHIYLVDS